MASETNEIVNHSTLYTKVITLDKFVAKIYCVQHMMGTSRKLELKSIGRRSHGYRFRTTKYN